MVARTERKQNIEANIVDIDGPLFRYPLRFHNAPAHSKLIGEINYVAIRGAFMHATILLHAEHSLRMQVAIVFISLPAHMKVDNPIFILAYA